MKIETLQEFRQAAFNGAWRGLTWQGFQKCTAFLGRKVFCVWSNGTGHHCAVGWLIPEREDRDLPRLQGARVSGPYLAEPFQVYLRKTDPDGERIAFDFLAMLQSAHDFSRTPGDMEKRMRTIADRYSLTIPEDT